MEAQNAIALSGYVIVADDDDDHRSLMAALLRNARMSVCEARSGHELVERYRDLTESGATPALVVSDVEMPGMDGIAATKELRALTKNTPIVLMTGYSHAQVAHAAREAGADAVLPKPVPVAGFFETLERLRVSREKR
jgi:CheY-like chemotaxis protein